MKSELDKVLSMSDSEVDAGLAELVMGWKRKVATDGTTEYWDNGTFTSGMWVESVDKSAWKLPDDSNVWNPTVDIIKAMMVETKMKEICSLDMLDKYVTNLSVVSDRIIGGFELVHVSANTRSRAALLTSLNT